MLRGILHNPCSNVVRSHRRREKDIVKFEISMHDLALVRVCDAANQVKSYPFSEREWEDSCLRLDERFHIASIYRHHEAHVRASRTFPGNRGFVQK